jgi:Flp pilus assembly protein TadG
MRRKIKSQRGTAAVEFALVLPLLILILFGTIEFGLLLYNQQVITNASREGSRAGIVVGSSRVTDAEISNVVGNYCLNNLVSFDGNTAPVIEIDPSGNRNGSLFGTDLSVTVTYEYSFLVLSTLGFGNQTLRATTLMKME